MNPRSLTVSLVRALRPALRSATLPLALLVASAPATAGNRQWTPLGPDGGSIVAIAVDPADGAVYAATPTTVFRSSDGGDTWTFAGAGLGGSAAGIRTLAVVSGAVIAGSTWDGLWRSRDGGRSWQPLTAGLPPRPHVETLVLDPGHDQRLWAGTWEGLFSSDDRGERWTARSGDLPLRGGVRSLAVDGFTSQLFARTVDELFTSTDDGESWSLVRCFGLRCGDAVTHPQRSGTLFTVSGAILRSRDAGATWQKLKGPKGGSFTLLGFHGERLFVAVRSYRRGVPADRLYWSDDEGDHWAAAAQSPTEPWLGALASADADTLFLGSSGITGAGGVFRSRDGGDRWEAASTGLSPRWIEALLVHPLEPGVLFAKAADHLFTSADDGAIWRVSRPATGYQAFGAGDLLIDPDLPERVWSTDSVDFLRSDDGGRRWALVRRVGVRVYAVEADGRTPGGVWAGTSEGLYQSPDGRAWKRVFLSGNDVGALDVAAHPADPRIVWVAGYGSTGPLLLHSADGGQSWAHREEGLPGWGVTRVALDPLRLDTLFVAAADGIFRSRDSGASWQRLPAPDAIAASPEAIRWEVLISPAAPTTLYAHLDSLEHEGVYRSADAGDTWQRVGANSGEAGAGSIRALVVDPHDPRRLLVGTSKRGVLTWTDAAP